MQAKSIIYLGFYYCTDFGRTRQGIKVFMHGAKGHTQGRIYSEDVLQQLGFPAAHNWNQVKSQLSSTNFSFMSLQHLSPPLDHIISLRAMFGLRSPVHTLTRLLNPLGAQHTIDGVFHPAYGACINKQPCC